MLQKHFMLLFIKSILKSHDLVETVWKQNKEECQTSISRKYNNIKRKRKTKNIYNISKNTKYVSENK